jgi:hypothetical protein
MSLSFPTCKMDKKTGCPGWPGTLVTPLRPHCQLPAGCIYHRHRAAHLSQVQRLMSLVQSSAVLVQFPPSQLILRHPGLVFFAGVLGLGMLPVYTGVSSRSCFCSLWWALFPSSGHRTPSVDHISPSCPSAFGPLPGHMCLWNLP